MMNTMVNAAHSSTLVIPSECGNTTASSNTASSASSPRRLSQTITDIVTGSNPNTTRSRSGSSPRSPSPTHAEIQTPKKLSIEFEGGTHIIVRPNRIIRGNIDAADARACIHVNPIVTRRRPSQDTTAHPSQSNQNQSMCASDRG